MVTVGLTGDVGAGKSTLCSVWHELGAFVIDSDTIAREMWFVPSVQKKVKKRWGESFFDGKGEDVYSRIADKIFTDGKEYQFMCKTIYPAVEKEIKRQIKKAAKKYSWVVTEVPLLFECGYEDMFDVTVYATASLEKRATRNAVRNFNKAELKRRQAKFMPRRERMSKADFVLRNSGTEEQWRNKAVKFAKKILKIQKDAEFAAKIK